MTLRRILLVAVAATLLTGAFMPTASADHCRTKLTAYGRISTAPAPSPPYASTTSGMCLALYGRGVDDHVLPPETDQVMVRVNGDFGPAIGTILIELNGLGFEGHTYPAIRTLSPFGGIFYQLPQWVSLPGGPQSGVLHVTAHYPGGTVTEVYRTIAAPLEPEVPEAPALPAAATASCVVRRAPQALGRIWKPERPSSGSSFLST